MHYHGREPSVTSAAIEDLKLLILNKGLTIISSPCIARKMLLSIGNQCIIWSQSYSSCVTFANYLIEMKNSPNPNPLDPKQYLETYEVEDKQENEYEYEIENKN
jgi:hypothetical protein